jgi:hypothetical protein
LCCNFLSFFFLHSLDSISRSHGEKEELDIKERTDSDRIEERRADIREWDAKSSSLKKNERLPRTDKNTYSNKDECLRVSNPILSICNFDHRILGRAGTSVQ